jgi:hypothetical protein
MSQHLSTDPNHKAQVLLGPARVALCQRAALEAQMLAEQGAMVNTSQIRGLVNALGLGPGRRKPEQRRMELARYLAWRAHRASENGGWARLAPAIQARVGNLETSCREEVAQLSRDEQGYWSQHGKALQVAQAWLEIEVLETFVHTLARLAAVAK